MTRIPFKAALDKCPAMAPATAARCVGSASKTGSRKVDVLVVGAGMVGSSLAAAIGRNPVFSGRSVCVLEAAPKKAYVSPGPGNFSNRVSALNLGTVNFLTKAGAWPLIRQADGGGRCTSFRRMLVWDEAAGSVQTEFLADAVSWDNNKNGSQIIYLNISFETGFFFRRRIRSRLRPTVRRITPDFSVTWSRTT